MSTRKKILLASGFVHILLFAFFLIGKENTSIVNNKIVVKNITQITEIPKPRPKVLPPKKSPPKTQSPKPPQKKVKAKKTPPKAPEKKVTKTTSSNAKILHDLSEALANLEKTDTATPATSSNSLNIPKQVERHKIETVAQSSIKQPVDLNPLIQLLENRLEFPENGAVTIEITIDPEGKMSNLSVLHSKSKKNANYLKNRLPHLTFPCLNTSDQTQTYTIRFKNL